MVGLRGGVGWVGVGRFQRGRQGRRHNPVWTEEWWHRPLQQEPLNSDVEKEHVKSWSLCANTNKTQSPSPFPLPRQPLRQHNPPRIPPARTTTSQIRMYQWMRPRTEGVSERASRVGRKGGGCSVIIAVIGGIDCTPVQPSPPPVASCIVCVTSPIFRISSPG